MTSECIVCRNEQFKNYLKYYYELDGTKMSLIRCTGCGLVKTDPPITNSDLSKLYNPDYFTRDYASDMRNGNLDLDRDLINQINLDLLKLVVKYRRQGNLLDVGCADGSFINYARAAFKVEGIEYSDIPMFNPMLDIHRGSFELTELPAEHYDVVLMIDVFEHFIDPVLCLKKLHNILSPEGIVVIKVPTYLNSLYYRTLSAFGRFLPLHHQPVLKLPKNHNPLPYHVYEHTPKTITTLLERHGFWVQEAIQSVPLLYNPNGSKLLKHTLNVLNSLTRYGLRGGSITLVAKKT